jgi:nicotinate-nucleotide adenylyltransferase
MRLGIFGGTFDPVHLGHLILAEQCREQARLDQVLFVPAARPPHKEQRALTPFAQRVEMLSLAVAGHAAFKIDELEKDRAGPSYTVHTLEAIHERHPDAELLLLIGSDTLHDLPQWYEPIRILQLAGLLIAARPDWQVLSPPDIRAALRLSAEVPLRTQVVRMPLIDISSRDLRRRAGQNVSLRYLVPRAVEAYIQDKRLYAPAP